MGYKPTIFSGRTVYAVLMGRVINVKGVSKSSRKMVTVQLTRPTDRLTATVPARMVSNNLKKNTEVNVEINLNKVKKKLTLR